MQPVTAEIDTVIAKKSKEMAHAASLAGIHFRMNRIDQGLFTHGIDNAGRAENGQSPFDAQAGIERTGRQLFSAGNGNNDDQPFRIPGLLRFCTHGFFYHAPWRRIDGRTSPGAGKAVTGHTAHTGTTAKADALLCFFCRGVDENAVGNIGVITAILADGTGHPVRPDNHIFRLQIQHNAAGRHEAHVGNRLLGKEHTGRCLGGGSGTTSCRIAAAQFFSLYDFVSIHRLSCYIVYTTFFSIITRTMPACQPLKNEDAAA